MIKEIELKYLVPLLSSSFLSKFKNDEIRQGYLSTGQPEVRIRDIGGTLVLDVKKGGGLVREEVPGIPLTQNQFIDLWNMTSDRVYKTRFYISHGEFIIEYDVYKFNLKRLCTAEVEFNDLSQITKWKPPIWCLRDVTNESIYKNRRLATLRVSIMTIYDFDKTYADAFKKLKEEGLID